MDENSVRIHQLDRPYPLHLAFKLAPKIKKQKCRSFYLIFFSRKNLHDSVAFEMGGPSGKRDITTEFIDLNVNSYKKKLKKYCRCLFFPKKTSFSANLWSGCFNGSACFVGGERRGALEGTEELLFFLFKKKFWREIVKLVDLASTTWTCPLDNSRS